MKEFMLLFRQPGYDYSKASQNDMQALAKKWQDWVAGIISQDKLVSQGPRLELQGTVLKPGGVVTEGPFVEVREILGSFIIVRAESLEEATTLAHGCPVLDFSGSVEIRPLYGY